MKNTLFAMLLVCMLAACAPAVTPVPTETRSSTLIPTPTFPPATETPSPAPTDPVFPVITPDPIQVERWKEYESALAQKLFPSSFIPDEFLCEWEVLGKLEQELYVWTVCMSIFSVGNAGFPYHMEMPAVIHVKKDGEVQEVEIPRGGTHYAADIRRMFPPTAQERYFNNLIPFQELTDHLRWRREHPEEPPLIILGITLTPTAIEYTPSLMSTIPPPPILTPDANQVERWKEYQTELAKALFSYASLTDPQNIYDPEEYKDALCEWDILGRASQEVYVWAACKATKFFDSMDMVGIEENPIVIYLEPDGSIQKVNIIRAEFKNSLPVYDLQLFPIDAQEILCLYYFTDLVPQCFSITSTYKPAEYPHPRLGTLSLHIGYRKAHPEEPPLNVISATPIP